MRIPKKTLTSTARSTAIGKGDTHEVERGSTHIKFKTNFDPRANAKLKVPHERFEILEWADPDRKSFGIGAFCMPRGTTLDQAVQAAKTQWGLVEVKLAHVPWAEVQKQAAEARNTRV